MKVPYAHTNTCMHTCMHVHICTHTCTHTCTNTHTHRRTLDHCKEKSKAEVTALIQYNYKVYI